jgi:hypothetical protein
MPFWCFDSTFDSRHLFYWLRYMLPGKTAYFSLILRVFSKEATNTNFIVFGLTRPGLEPNIYHTRGENANHYTTDVVYCKNCWIGVKQQSLTHSNTIQIFFNYDILKIILFLYGRILYNWWLSMRWIQGLINPWNIVFTKIESD